MGTTPISILGAILLLWGDVAACASVQPPRGRVASAQSALRAAEEVGAARIPSAALHLQLAREEVAQAQKLIERGQHLRADFVLRRAEADAELSLALAREVPSRVAAQNAIDRLNNLEPTQIP